MEENEFWLSLWKVVGVIVVAITLTVGGCVSHSNYRKIQAIELGATAFEANCAFGGDAPTSCDLVEVSKNDK